MKALIYLTKRSFINNLKRAVTKPTTLIALIFGIAYGAFVIFGLGVMAIGVHIDSVKGLLAILTIWSIYDTFGNLQYGVFMTHLVIFSDILREKELFSDPDTHILSSRLRSIRNLCLSAVPG